MKKLFCALLICALVCFSAAAELVLTLPEDTETLEEYLEGGEGYTLYSLDGGITFAEVYTLMPTVYGMIGEGTARDFADLFGDAAGAAVTETVLEPVNGCQAVRLSYVKGSNEDTSNVEMIAVWADEATYVVFITASAEYGDTGLVESVLASITVA